MDNEVKKTLLNLLKTANEKGIKNDATFYKLTDIEHLLYYQMEQDEYNTNVVEMLIAVKAILAKIENEN